MEEIFQIADEITVFRDGKSVITKDVKDWTMDQVVECMVGRKIENQYPKENIPIGEEILKLKIFHNLVFSTMLILTYMPVKSLALQVLWAPVVQKS